MKGGDGSRYSNSDPIVSFMMLASAVEGGGDVGRAVPQSDAEDFSRGARFIPSEVTLARRRGLRVAFVAACSSSKCCWYWEFMDTYTEIYGEKGEKTRVLERGARIYHYEQASEGWIRHEAKTDPPTCPSCANAVIFGGTYDPQGNRMSYE